MSQEQLVFGEDRSIAERNKLSGMHASISHANRIDPLWSEKAYKKLLDFLKEAHSIEFMAEQVRSWAEHRGLTKPPSARSWGSVIRRASTSGLIEFVRYAKTTNPNAHRTPANVWKKIS